MVGNTTNFNGRPSQILLRMFEPVEILEKAGVQHYNPNLHSHQAATATSSISVK
jgi:hypothetical protein